MIKELSNTEIIQVLGNRFRTYRVNLRMTQKELSEKTGISVPTIRNFEAGKTSNISLSILLTLMRDTGLIEYADRLIPEQPISPYTKQQLTKVRHGNKKKQ